MTNYRIESVTHSELEEDVLYYPPIAVPRAVRDKMPYPPGTTCVLREIDEAATPHVIAAAELRISQLEDDLARYQVNDERMRAELNSSADEVEALRAELDELRKRNDDLVVVVNHLKRRRSQVRSALNVALKQSLDE